MELFKYIVKFIYRIRWWMVIFPCIAGIIAWFLTRNLEKTYDVKTTIFTGIISGYNVDATDTRNATVHMSNLMNIITTERTLKIVSLKLLARCLVYGACASTKKTPVIFQPYITSSWFPAFHESYRH